MDSKKSTGSWNNRLAAVYRAQMLEFVVFKRRRNFCWQVRDQNGKMVAIGTERTRPAARYRAYRALLLLLSTGRQPTDLQPRQAGFPRGSHTAA
jgi:hypothetical protein